MSHPDAHTQVEQVDGTQGPPTGNERAAPEPGDAFPGVRGESDNSVSLSSNDLILGDTFESFHPSVSYAPLRRMYPFQNFVFLTTFVVLGIGITIAWYSYFQHHRMLAGIITILVTVFVCGLIFYGSSVALSLRSIKLPGGIGWEGSATGRFKSKGPSEFEVNQESLNRYQQLTQSQATSSYRVAQTSIFAGLIMLLAGAYYAIRTDDTTAQIIVGGLAAMGSAISGYIGATSIRMYQRAQAQMNFYYAQPLVQSYILQAERLCKLLSKDRRDAAYEKVIDQTLEGASVAGFLITRTQDDGVRIKGKRREDPGVQTPQS